MLFAALIDYTTDVSKIAEHRPAHRAYLKSLLDSNRLAISGPFMDDRGGLLVYSTETLEETESIIRNDPFTQAGVFVSWTIRPWRVVMSNPSLIQS